MRNLTLVLAVVACGGANSPPSPAPREGAALRPVTLVYSGQHRGDHPPWSYRQTVTIAAAERAGRPVWRRTQQLEGGRMLAMLDIDQATLAPVHNELTWDGAIMRVDHAPGRTTGVVEAKGARREVAHQHAEPAVLSDALDLWLAAQPLAVGQETRVSLLDLWLLDEPVRYGVRPFTMRVLREEKVRVPAGELATFVIALEPMDGDERARATYHVLTTAPHYTVRSEYVVHPKSVGNERRSVGTEELVRITS